MSPDGYRRRYRSLQPSIYKGYLGKTFQYSKSQHLYEHGFRRIAAYHLRSYTSVDHEQAVGELTLQAGFAHISLMGIIKAVLHGTSATSGSHLPDIMTPVFPSQQTRDRILVASMPKLKDFVSESMPLKFKELYQEGAEVLQVGSCDQQQDPKIWSAHSLSSFGSLLLALDRMVKDFTW
ncbi:hypothetical protein EC968_003223, partial [Mortierella alpina]